MPKPEAGSPHADQEVCGLKRGLPLDVVAGYVVTEASMAPPKEIVETGGPGILNGLEPPCVYSDLRQQVCPGRDHHSGLSLRGNCRRQKLGVKSNAAKTNCVQTGGNPLKTKPADRVGRRGKIRPENGDLNSANGNSR